MGRMHSESMSFIMSQEMIKVDFMFSVVHFKIKYRPRYLNDSPLLATGKSSLLMKSLGSNCRDLEESFLIEKVTHLSTVISTLANCNHLVK